MLPPLSRALRLAVALLLAIATSGALHAHMLVLTRLSVALAPDEAELRIDADISFLLGGSAAYTALLRATPEIQAARLPVIAREILDGLTPSFTPATEPWRLVSWKLPALGPDQEIDPDAATMTGFVWRARLPAPLKGATLQVASSPASRLEFPVACSLLVPDSDRTITRWLEAPGSVTEQLPLPALAAPGATVAPTAAPESTGWFATVAQYLRLGFLHILPLGLDHILFVLGLYFLGAGWRALAAQITTFTVAHTTTLGLAAAGIVHVSPSIVEPLIALSIAFVALENIFRPRLGPGRLVVVFCFGLLHGLGFAGALAELPLPRDQFLTALLSFNFGVDFGQLAILALAFLTVGWFRGQPWYRRAIAIPACALIASTGLYWTVERAFF